MESTAQSIVSKFGQVLVEELQEIRGVRNKVVHLRDELATMNALLRVISEAEEGSVDHLVREWEKQVHDLAYDAEDCIDVYSLGISRPAPLPPADGTEFTFWAKYLLAHAKRIVKNYYEKLVLQRTLPRLLADDDEESPTNDDDEQPADDDDFVAAPPIFRWARYMLARAKHIVRYPYDKLVLQRALAADIKDLLARTTIISERRARYGIDRATLPRASYLAPVSAASISVNALRRADDPDQFVGIENQANDLAKKIKGPVHDEDDQIKAPVHDQHDKMKALVHDEDVAAGAPRAAAATGAGSSKTTAAASAKRPSEHTPPPPPRREADFDFAAISDEEDEEEEEETLAHRTKKAKVGPSHEPMVIVEDEPAASTGVTSETTLPGSESSPRRSPQRSPQRKCSDHFPLAGAGEYVFVDDIVGRAGEEEQHEVPLGDAPDAPPPSTTPPRRDSPARAPTGEPSQEATPASTEAPSTEAGGPTPTTNKEPIYDEDDKSLKVFSIVGFGGLGKTTLAMELCRQLDADFPCQALVSVSQAFDVGKDMKGLLVRVLQQILKGKADAKANQTNKEEEAQIDKMNVEELSSKIKELLDHKRYLIVIDDVWSLPAWEAIRYRLPKNNCGSRIIVTTRMEAVAKAASVYFVHHMEPLKPDDSKKLFVKRVFGSIEEGTYPNGLEEHMETILKKCGGLPLAIVSIASLLASYTSAEATVMWERVSRSIGSHMESHPTLEGMRKLITLSYDYLPHHLKACMMYLSIFPEDFVVAKDRLLYRWIAEGLVTEKRGLTLLEIAEEYFNELISRNMIQLVKFVSLGVEVEGCRVHDMILEVMVSKSKESNFVSLVGWQYGGMTDGHGKVRRLSIHDNDQGPEKVEAMKLQHVRSLTTFQKKCDYGLGKLLDRLGEFKLLRVLDLEDCEALQNKHMRDVCRLYILRFLSLRGTEVSEMPHEVGNLEHLETLDIKNTEIREDPPRTVTKLSKLERLRSDYWILPRGLGNMKALREVDMGVLTGDDVEVAQDIGELTRLQVLSIEIMNKDELKEALASSLSKTSALQSLHLQCCLDDPTSLEFLFDVSPPPLLQCLGLVGDISQLPDWISSLTHLTKFEVGCTELAGDQLFGVLCKLPSLQSVELYTIECKDGELVARPEHSFPVLRILEVIQCPRVLTFEKGSMKKLEKLVLSFGSMEMSVVGIENLGSLKEVKLTGWKGNPAIERALEQLKALSTESNQIKVVVDLW